MILDRIDPKIINVIDSQNLERDLCEKPVSTFSHPAQAESCFARAAKVCLRQEAA
jgi:hypothetical protein